MSSQLDSNKGGNYSERADRDSCTLRSRLHGDLVKTVLQHGQGCGRPLWESRCVVDITRVDNGDTTGNNSALSNQQGEHIELTLGQAGSDFMQKVEVCVLTMREGEVSNFVFTMCEPESVITIPSENSTDIPTNTREVHTSVRISLQSFSQPMPSWRLSSHEKYNLALSYKGLGTELFRAGNTQLAFHRYSRAIKYLICVPELSTVSEASHPNCVGDNDGAVSLEELRALQCVCHLNLAACQAKVANHGGVIENCSRALALDADSVKALYRRAVASIACGHKEDARKDLLRAQKLEPHNKVIESLLKTCQL